LEKEVRQEEKRAGEGMEANEENELSFRAAHEVLVSKDPNSNVYTSLFTMYNIYLSVYILAENTKHFSISDDTPIRRDHI